MATTNLDDYNLRSVERGGLVREDIMEKIFILNVIPLPFTELLSKRTHSHARAEFTTDELAAPATDNKLVDGQDYTGDDSSVGDRQSNWSQISGKIVQVSERANYANSVGRQGSRTYQIMRRQQELRRDVEAQMASNLPSIEPTDTVAGQSAGIGAWIKTNAFYGATGSAGGWNGTTGLIDAPTPGTKRAMSETLLRDAQQAAYQAGVEPSKLMMTPEVTRLVSEYMFTDSARIATMSNYDTNARPDGRMKAHGSAQVFIGDFGVLEFVDNRLQPKVDTDVSNAYLLTPQYLYQSFMQGYQTKPLGKTGLSTKDQITVDYSLLATNEKAQAVVADIDEATPMVG